MTLPGGAADKLGNRYEKWWTLSEFVRMLQGDTEAVRIEAPGVDKAEFVVTVGAHRELHQVKRSHPNGKWSLAALRGDGLLEAIGRYLAGNHDQFVFASGSDARALADLCESARHAVSPEEFERRFLAAGGRRNDFRTLLDCWTCDVPAAIDRLRRVNVHTIDERQLESKVSWGMQALFLASPNDVVAALRAIAEDAVHRTISRPELVNALSRRGYRLRHLTNPTSAGDAVRHTTDHYLDGTRRRLIHQQLVRREASKTLLTRLQEQEGQATDSVLTGKAGSGKTACVVEVVDALRARGVPVLAFRLDRLARFASASTTVDLGRVLDLEESPTLVLAAAAQAAGLPGVLIVDQLDAVSTISGRNSGVFDLVEQLLSEARGSRPRAALHTVVVCRQFDWENDARLRRLMPSDADAQAAKVDVAEFSIDEVKEILAAGPFDPASFAERQLKILQLPQNLSLFLDAEFDPSRPPPFRTATGIFDRYWRAKQRSMAERVAPAPDNHWMAVIETLCDDMTRNQQLSVRREVLDVFPRDYVDQLASEGLLAADARRFAFSHESFLDYAFARVFVRRTEPLVSFLKASEQHLFRRAQVRQVLAYLRDTDRRRYAAELRGLLADRDVRPHLKDLACALLAEVPDPGEDEWAIWQPWIFPALSAVADGTPNPDRISAMAWRRFFGARSWFAQVDRRNLIERWLNSPNDRIIDMAVRYLRVHHLHAPDRAAALLEPHADRGGLWTTRLRRLMEGAEYHTSRPFFDLFLRLVDNGTLDEARRHRAENTTFWSMFCALGEHRPDWIPEVVDHRLHRQLATMEAAGDDLTSHSLFHRDELVPQVIVNASSNAADAFVEHILPVVLKVSDAAAIGEVLPKHDTVWSFMISSSMSGEDACLSGLAGALAMLARERPTTLRNVIPALCKRHTQVANHLLMALYAGGAAHHADEAIVLLCDQPWRFEEAFFHYADGHAEAVIRAAVPHCTGENRARLESVILNYVSQYERSPDGYKRHGRARLSLLSAIPPRLRTTRANAHLAELIRKFGEPADAPEMPPEGVVESPIDENAVARMNDDQWLRAIEKHSSEERRAVSGRRPTGGPSELARLLGNRVKAEPHRFAHLALCFPVDVNPVYLRATLNALKDAAIADDLKLRVCRKAFKEWRLACGTSIAGVLGRTEDALPDEAVGMLTRLATHGAASATQSQREDTARDRCGDDDIYFCELDDMEATRASAAFAIQDLIFKDTAYVERFRSVLGRMVRDSSPSVRSFVAVPLRAMAYHDAPLAMALFLSMDISEDRLLAKPPVSHFIRDQIRDSFSELQPIVGRMLGSLEPGVREVGARLAGISALHHGSATDLADKALNSDDARSRRGLARAAADNIAVPEHRAWCEKRLIPLFDDLDAEVRHAAARCFVELADGTLDVHEELIKSFCNSRAFENSRVVILRALERTRGQLPAITCMVCEKYLAGGDDDAIDVHTGRLVDPYGFVKLVFRTYQQHLNDQWASRALDLIDRLCLEGITGTGNEFEEFER